MKKCLFRGQILACPIVLSMIVFAEAAVQYVIDISVDGLGSGYLQALIDGNNAPNFKRFQTEGAWTNNARDDYNITVTLPNHVTMVTARGILGQYGHGWTGNSDPAPGETIHSNKGSYVAGVFDVAHDNGLSTAMYATKGKFTLFDFSYNAANGALDTTGDDNGPDKLDTFYLSNSSTATTSFIAAMNGENPFNFSFLHFTDGDTAGHNSGWGSDAYNNAIMAVDGYLGSIFNLVDDNNDFKDKTAIILTADHGGHYNDHSDAADPLNYTIPFYVWGPGVTAGADLYGLNAATRLDPGGGRPNYSATIQPIRNGDMANLSLELLGYGPIPGSTINPSQNLLVPEPSMLALLLSAGAWLAWRRRRRNAI